MLLVTCLVCVFISVVHSAPKSCCYLLVLVDSDIFYGWCSNSVTCWTPGSVSFSLELIVLPPSVVDGCSRNPLYYYYYWWVGRLLPTEYYRPMVSLGFIYFAFATFLFPVTSVGISAWHCDFFFFFFLYGIQCPLFWLDLFHHMLLLLHVAAFLCIMPRHMMMIKMMIEGSNSHPVCLVTDEPQ